MSLPALGVKNTSHHLNTNTVDQPHAFKPLEVFLGLREAFLGKL